MLPKNRRIIIPSDFYKIKKFGNRLSSNNFSISYLSDKEINFSIFSVVVSKAIAKKSSDRNRLKRIYKSIIIRNLNQIPKNLKCIVFPKVTSFKVKNSELESEFLKLISQL
jgi:ribonuclease P protein component